MPQNDIHTSFDMYLYAVEIILVCKYSIIRKCCGYLPMALEQTFQCVRARLSSTVCLTATYTHYTVYRLSWAFILKWLSVILLVFFFFFLLFVWCNWAIYGRNNKCFFFFFVLVVYHFHSIVRFQINLSQWRWSVFILHSTGWTIVVHRKNFFVGVLLRLFFILIFLLMLSSHAYILLYRYISGELHWKTRSTHA